MSIINFMEKGLEFLKLSHPPTGRMIAEDGNTVNMAEHIRSLPINIARGLMPGARAGGSYGERVVTGAEVDVPVWPNGPIVALPQAGVQMTVVSTDAADDAAGTNVRTVEFHYLNGDLDIRTETLVMDGLTPVLTQAEDIRWIQCMHLTSFGDNPAAAGTITMAYAGDTFSQIDPGKVRCSSSFRMVPRGKVLFLGGAVGSSISATADTRTQMSLVASELDNHTYHDPLILIPFAGIGLQNGGIGFNFPPGIRFSAGTLVGGLHTTNKAGVVTLSWFGHLENAPDAE